MTKKNFIGLADMVKNFNQFEDEPFTERQIKELANFCVSMSPRFNRGLWLDYINGLYGSNGGKIV